MLSGLPSKPASLSLSKVFPGEPGSLLNDRLSAVEWPGSSGIAVTAFGKNREDPGVRIAEGVALARGIPALLSELFPQSAEAILWSTDRLRGKFLLEALALPPILASGTSPAAPSKGQCQVLINEGVDIARYARDPVKPVRPAEPQRLHLGNDLSVVSQHVRSGNTAVSLPIVRTPLSRFRLLCLHRMIPVCMLTMSRRHPKLDP